MTPVADVAIEAMLAEAIEAMLAEAIEAMLAAALDDLEEAIEKAS